MSGDEEDQKKSTATEDDGLEGVQFQGMITSPHASTENDVLSF